MEVGTTLEAGGVRLSIESLRFLLVPDAGAARRVRRLIAERGACTGVVVGTWPELVEWARRSYLLPEPGEDWDAVFADGTREPQRRVLGGELQGCAGGDAPRPWGLRSWRCCRRASRVVILRTLKLDGLAERPRRHLADLLRLAKALGGRLPPELEAIRDLLAADSQQCAACAQRDVRRGCAGADALAAWRSSRS